MIVMYMTAPEIPRIDADKHWGQKVGGIMAVSYTHLRAHETPEHLVCRLLLEKKKKKSTENTNRILCVHDNYMKVLHIEQKYTTIYNNILTFI